MGKYLIVLLCLLSAGSAYGFGRKKKKVHSYNYNHAMALKSAASLVTVRDKAATDASSLTDASKAIILNAGNGQKDAQLASAQSDKMGADAAAALGVVACAESANTIKTNDPASGALVQSCVDSFAAAREMKEMEEKSLANAAGGGAAGLGTLLGVNEAVLQSEQAQSILDDLEKKYDISKEEFIRAIVEAKGDPEVMGKKEFLDGLLNGKITREDVEKAIRAAEALSDEERANLLADSRVSGLGGEFQFDMGKGGSRASAASSESKRKSLREILREKSDRSPAGGANDTASILPKEWGKKLTDVESELTPARDPAFEAAQQADAEAKEGEQGDLTIFDVVHKKYFEKREALLVRKAKWGT